jgi:hypothetical protein
MAGLEVLDGELGEARSQFLALKADREIGAPWQI